MSLKERAEVLLEKIELACQRSGRRSSDLTVIAVTKNVGVDLLLEAYKLGFRHFGENRLPNALEKQAALPRDAVWHFIGTIQGNKLVKIASFFSYLHGVDSIKVAERLSSWSVMNGKKCSCFLEINASKEQSKRGFFLEEFSLFKKQLFSLEGLFIQGLMTMAPHTTDETLVRSCFQAVARLSYDLPKEARQLSMGMSSDFTIAIEEGATHIRVGSALFQS